MFCDIFPFELTAHDGPKEEIRSSRSRKHALAVVGGGQRATTQDHSRSLTGMRAYVPLNIG